MEDCNKWEVCRLLADGADPNEEIHPGISTGSRGPLNCAIHNCYRSLLRVREDCYEIVKKLLDFGASPYTVIYSDWVDMPLELIEHLLKTNPEVVFKQDKIGTIFLSEAVERDDKKLICMLIEAGANVDFRREGETYLFTLCQKGNVELAELLIVKGAEVNVRNKFFETPLHVASSRGDLKMIDLLLKHKANTYATGPLATPLSRAAADGHEAAVRLLLKKGANPLVPDIPREEYRGGFIPIPKERNTFEYARKGLIPLIFENRFNYLKNKLKNKSWRRMRLLWIAQKKENSDDCSLAMLPRDMVKQICSYDLSSDKEKEEVGWFELEQEEKKYLEKTRGNA